MLDPITRRSVRLTPLQKLTYNLEVVQRGVYFAEESLDAGGDHRGSGGDWTEERGR